VIAEPHSAPTLSNRVWDAATLRAWLTAATPEAPSWAGTWAALADDAERRSPHDLVPAAVLVGIVTAAAPGVLLTKRTATLRRHSGQVSFPGGRIDPDDSSPEAAALREAHEEIGLEPGFVELLGRLPDYVTSTGYLVTPVLALVSPGFTTTLSAAEVDAVFELPLTTLLDPTAPERRQAEFAGRLREYWVWPHAEHFIWGATAAILVHLAARLGGAVAAIAPADSARETPDAP
jgi:8-oxo-dGTP pyrophosphatase MutT (NUDIX family)